MTTNLSPQAIIRAEELEELANRLLDAIEDEAKFHGWDTMAEKTIEVYNAAVALLRD